MFSGIPANQSGKMFVITGELIKQKLNRTDLLEC